MCFKPVDGCRIREIVGQKALKGVVVGQQCSLFIRLLVPRIHVRDSTTEPDQDSLFTELESIVGTLEAEILHVEARYRHPFLPSDNIVNVRHICKIKRPKTDSRWSTVGTMRDTELQPSVYVRLARYLSDNHQAERALAYLQQYLGPRIDEFSDVRDIYKELSDQSRQSENLSKPSVVITDIDLGPRISTVPISEPFTTAPSTPLGRGLQSISSDQQPSIDATRRPSSPSVSAPTRLGPPLIAPPKATTALTPGISIAESLRNTERSNSQDTARKVWRHIRRTSLSAKQLEEIAAEGIEHLEANDDTLKELRQKALANKRSVGAETLRAWKWEDSAQANRTHAEAPWM